jgi:hypothetical protein
MIRCVESSSTRDEAPPPRSPMALGDIRSPKAVTVLRARLPLKRVQLGCSSLPVWNHCLRIVAGGVAGGVAGDVAGTSCISRPLASVHAYSHVLLRVTECTRVTPQTGLKIRVSGVQFPPWPLCRATMRMTYEPGDHSSGSFA